MSGAQTATFPLLEVRGLSKSFSGLRAVADLDFRVDGGEILAIIGPNGAGKTTVFNLLSRTYAATTGSVTFDGRDVLRLPAHKVTALGMVRTFQNLRLFQNMTALDNVKVARYCRTRGGIVSALLRSGTVKSGERETERLARELLEFVSLGDRAGEVAKSLPYGDQKRLEIARALATDPRLLLLDEPAAGLNDTESAALVALLGRIRESGVTIVLIEHDMKVVMKLSERIVVLDHGIKLCEGTPEEVRCDPRVVEAYLGKAAAGGPA